MTDILTLESDCRNGSTHPRFTQNLIGQDNAINDFLAAFNSGRLHHAWLLTGPYGVGKASLAWKIARFLLAQEPKNNPIDIDRPAPIINLDVPDDHPIMSRIDALSEARLYLARRLYDEKTKKLKQAITVDEIRKLKRFFNLSATDGGWRVVIIDAADELNTPAANALLKILEEPPEKTILLLVCHQAASLLPTLRSRCRELRCKTLSTNDLTQVLENIGITNFQESQALNILALGSVGEAIELIHIDGVKLYAEIIHIIKNAPNSDRNAILALANSCTGKSTEAKFNILTHLFYTFLARLARYGAMKPLTTKEDALGEHSLFERLAPNQIAAQKWAALLQDITQRIQHGRRVNIDPSTLILDMFIKFDETAQK